MQVQKTRKRHFLIWLEICTFQARTLIKSILQYKFFRFLYAESHVYTGNELFTTEISPVIDLNSISSKKIWRLSILCYCTYEYFQVVICTVHLLYTAILTFSLMFLLKSKWQGGFIACLDKLFSFLISTKLTSYRLDIQQLRVLFASFLPVHDKSLIYFS